MLRHRLVVGRVRERAAIEAHMVADDQLAAAAIPVIPPPLLETAAARQAATGRPASSSPWVIRCNSIEPGWF